MATKDTTTSAWPATPAKIRKDITPPVRVFEAAIASSEVQDALGNALNWQRAIAQGRKGARALLAERSWARAVERAAQLLFASPAGIYCDSYERMLANVNWLINAWATGKVSFPGLKFDTIKPGGKVRLPSLNGRTVFDRRDAPTAEARRAYDYFLWQTDFEAGRKAHLYGRSRKSAPEFYAVLEEGLNRCAGARLTQVLLSGHMGIDTHTLRGYLRDYGPPWPMLKKYRSLADCEANGWKRS